jgi:hypothetical protein
MFCNWGKRALRDTSGDRSSADGLNLVTGRLLGGIPGVLQGNPGGGVELVDAGELTRWFPGGPGGTLSVPRDNSPCHGNN